MKQDNIYTAHIAGNKYSVSFDRAEAEKFPDWKDCCIWVTGPDGFRKNMYDGSK